MTDPFLGDDLRIRYTEVLLRDGQAAAWEAVARLAAERLAPLVPWREISALSLDRAEVLEAERDALRAEVELWKQRAHDENVHRTLAAEAAEEFRAEIDRQQAEMHRLFENGQGFRHRAEEAEVEIERLRAVLFQIADDSAHADQYVRWAQDALERPDER